jgi:hypothetical protein
MRTSESTSKANVFTNTQLAQNEKLKHAGKSPVNFFCFCLAQPLLKEMQPLSGIQPKTNMKHNITSKSSLSLLALATAAALTSNAQAGAPVKPAAPAKPATPAAPKGGTNAPR